MTLLTVRATIHLPGLPLGAVAQIDPTLPYEAEALKAGYLVPVGGPVESGAAGAGESATPEAPDSAGSDLAASDGPPASA